MTDKTLTDVMTALTGTDADRRVVEVALDHHPETDEFTDEKHFVVMADTHKEAAEKAYELAEENYEHWSDATAIICGSHFPGKGGAEQDFGEHLQRNGVVFGPDVDHNGI